MAENFLDKKPKIKPGLSWHTDPDGSVVIERENSGFTNRLFQLLFKKPKISYIHLDETGSFIWPLIDGTNSIFQIAEHVKGRFGTAADPLYERLIQYFNTLSANGFVDLN